MIGSMESMHITEAELVRDIGTILDRVERGAEIVVERDARPVAVITTPRRAGRPILECIAIAKAYEERLGYAPAPDPGFAADVQAAIDAHREPLDLSLRD